MRFQQGDIVMVEQNPIQGQEQGQDNYRPVLILNSVPMPGGMSLLVPIVPKPKTYPLEVLLDARTQTRGCVLCFKMKTVDLQACKARYVEQMPKDLLEECLDYCQRLFLSDLG